jgi:hypothetical protein
MENRLKTEIKAFDGIWQGGYYEGDPLEPVARSNYGQIGYMSILHATYLRCIKPYIKPETVALEIGAGRGAWTRCLLPAKEVWCLDALTAEYNRFWEYIGDASHVRYIQVEDFECRALPDNHFDYLFSFGCFCHISFVGIEEYAKNLFPKLKSGANCFWLVADYEKYNRVVNNLEHHSIWAAAAPTGRRYAPFRKLLDLLKQIDRPEPIAADPDDVPRSGRWYNAGTLRTCEMLRKHGYEIVDEDVGTIVRDPVIHFRKP